MGIGEVLPRHLPCIFNFMMEQLCRRRERVGLLGGLGGFSLIEMATVVSIFAVMLMFAIPNFQDWNRKRVLKDGVATLQGNLSIARLNAINQNSTVTVTVCNQGVNCNVSTTTCQAATGNPAWTPTQVTVFFANQSGCLAFPSPNPQTMDSRVVLATSSGTTLATPQDVQFSNMGLWMNGGFNNGNDLCVSSSNAATACSSTSPQPFGQTFNFITGGATAAAYEVSYNYRVVVTNTGKVSWCYSATCNQ